jgi:hypothetical protein
VGLNLAAVALARVLAGVVKESAAYSLLSV